jgi:hypothetical protein
VGPKKQNFWKWWQNFRPKVNILKGFFFFLNLLMNFSLSKNGKIIFLKSIFDVKNQPIFFKNNSLKNIDLVDYFLEKNSFFLDSTFEPLYALKSCPIFDDINTYVRQWAFFMDQNGKLEQWPLQYLGLYFHARFSRSQSACPTSKASKGQLISKCLIGSIVSTKKTTKYF